MSAGRGRGHRQVSKAAGVCTSAAALGGDWAYELALTMAMA